jgi:Zn-dependent peptidase ImmA (M78 family)
MPRSGLIRRFNAAKDAAGGKLTPALLLDQAYLWHVSAEAMSRRLEDLKLIRAGMWEHLLRRGLKPDEGRQLLGLPPRTPDEVVLPRRYTLLAVNAYLDGSISEERLAHFLQADRVAARRAVRAFALDVTEPEPGSD